MGRVEAIGLIEFPWWKMEKVGATVMFKVMFKVGCCKEWYVLKGGRQPGHTGRSSWRGFGRIDGAGDEDILLLHLHPAHGLGPPDCQGPQMDGFSSLLKKSSILLGMSHLTKEIPGGRSHHLLPSRVSFYVQQERPFSYPTAG